ncbi:MAG: DUF3473 domain-containing protein [Nannocystaceae bacterium]|nr:DUF3473 domain-containing protein [Nannocystaceae bacterium]
MSPRRKGVMTVDLEDYRHHERERLTGVRTGFHPEEVGTQTERLLDLFEANDIGATFFTVGELAPRLPKTLWRRMAHGHRVGCHGYRHRHVHRIGAATFRDDLRAGKNELQDTTGLAVDSYRAPYFSADRCDPWFGEALAEAGFSWDSSRRLALMRSPGGVTSLPGGGDTVREVPLMSVGLGSKRLTVIGGTYFRLLPLAAIERLLDRAYVQGFAPMVYLHPYDIDANAEHLRFSGLGVRGALGDRVRQWGRGGVADKLAALCRRYDFGPLESLL